MPTSDISRWSTDFRKRYDGVRLQQGRVVTDDDVNEAARLEFEDRRRTRVDVIGPAGSPDNGFALANVTTGPAGPDFTIDAGTLYVGGLRLNLDDPTTYLGQSDFLQIEPIPAPAAGRVDLVYVEAWQQHVSAVEDSEIFEVALAGADTSTRLKPMQRIRVAAGVGGADCHAALDAVIAASPNDGTMTAQLERRTDAQLTVTFDPNTTPPNLCTPPVQGGYLGADNQAIRVEIVSPTEFMWGFDDASPMYRVQIKTDPNTAQRTVVHLLTAPKDQAHWPLADQTIELLPWGALLPNGEKVAETTGLLVKVQASFDPDTHDISIDTNVPLAFGAAWQQHAAAAALAAGEQFVFMRVWNRGADLATPAKIAFVPNGAAVPLGDTGLRVEFKGTQFRRGDHWVVAARPESRNVVVPWQLMTAREPHGYRRFVAPLGLISWALDANNALVGTVIDDCRPTFPPLTRIKSCCTYTVGDGVESFGQFASIQNAIEALPTGGGEICVLAGRHVGRIRIVGRRGIRIHGCGHRSLVVPGQEPNGGPLVYIEDSEFIELDRLRLEAPSGIQSRESDNEGAITSHLTFERLEIAVAHAAMDLEATRRIDIVDNQITLTGSLFRGLFPLDAMMAAVTVRSQEVLVERNEIDGRAAGGRLRGVIGGVHLRGGCERVDIRRNHIVGGNGNGVLLGSFVSVIRPVEGGRPGRVLFPGFIIVFDDDGCPHIIPLPPGRPDEPPPEIESEGFLYEILIHDNRIERMGTSGIASAYVVGPRLSRLPQVRGAVVIDLEISNNIIERCLELEIRDFSALLENRIAFGGIALQTVEGCRIRENRIRDSGTAHANPVCGVFAAVSSGIDIEENTIAGNGPLNTANQQSLFGTRGGIVLPIVWDFGGAIAARVFDREGRVEFAARVHDNIVNTPLGRALMIGAHGMVSVIANHFTGFGFPRRDDAIFANALTADANGVLIAPPPADRYTAHLSYLSSPGALSVSADAVNALVLIINLGSLDRTPAYVGFVTAVLERAARAPEEGDADGGQVLFDDNHVLVQAGGNVAPPPLCIVLASSDDVSMASNQSDYRPTVRMTLNTLVIGSTVRVTANRFQEPRAVTTMSALTFGTWNITALNQGTHCIVALPSAELIDTMNEQPLICRLRQAKTVDAMITLLRQ